jgi:hypothetical protein
MTSSNHPNAVPHGTFRREVQRLIEASGRTVEEVARAVELPVAAFTGAHGGAIQIPSSKLKRIGEELGIDDTALFRIYLQEFDPWLVELFDDLMRMPPSDEPAVTDRSAWRAARADGTV